MKKIGIVTEHFYPSFGGIAEHIYFFCQELLKRDFDVTVITGYQGQEPGRELPKGLKLIQLAKSMKVYANGSVGHISVAWNLGTKIQELLAKEKFDLLHLHNPLDPVLPLLFAKYARPEQILLGTFHAYGKFGKYLRPLNKIVQSYLDKFDGLIAVSKPCADLMNEFFPHPIKVLPNGVDVDLFSHPKHTITKFQDQRPTILYMARLESRNGILHVLRAFPLVLEKIPNARLIVVGDGPLRGTCEKMAGPLIDQSIFFEGMQYETRPDYFAVSQVYLYPIVAKGSFGIGILEGMAGNTPVIATKNNVFSTLIKDGSNGLLAETTNPQALASQMLRILEDKALAQQLQEEGFKTAQVYSWQKVSESILDYYDEVYKAKKNAKEEIFVA